MQSYKPDAITGSSIGSFSHFVWPDTGLPLSSLSITSTGDDMFRVMWIRMDCETALHEIYDATGLGFVFFFFFRYRWFVTCATHLYTLSSLFSGRGLNLSVPLSVPGRLSSGRRRLHFSRARNNLNAHNNCYVISCTSLGTSSACQHRLLDPFIGLYQAIRVHRISTRRIFDSPIVEIGMRLRHRSWTGHSNKITATMSRVHELNIELRVSVRPCSRNTNDQIGSSSILSRRPGVRWKSAHPRRDGNRIFVSALAIRAIHFNYPPASM